MERVLHRVNSLRRLQQAVDAGFDRIEIDLWYRHGRFVLSHDRPLGPWALGRFGAEFSLRPYLPVHWQGRFLHLPQLLDLQPPPLFVDLKGRWPPSAFGRLAAQLRSFERADDIVVCRSWRRLAAYRARVPSQRLAHGGTHNTLRKATGPANEAGRPSAVSIDLPSLKRSPGLVSELRASGVAVYAWKLGREDDLAWLEEAGVDGAIFATAAWRT